jgi:hypothetical protein
VTVLGIDPGLSGAIAALTITLDGQQTITITPTPTVWAVTGRGTRRRRYDVPAMCAALRHLRPVSLAYLEQQSARPGQGLTSTLSTGVGFGLWLGLLVACAVPFVLVTPPVWRRRAGIPGLGGDKAAVRLAAMARFPGVPIPRDHADAVLLAVAARAEM